MEELVNRHELFLNSPLSNDFYFKKVMSEKKILQKFLRKVMGIEQVGDLVKIETNYELYEFKDSHKIICDIYAEDKEGRIFIVENQNYPMKHFLYRLEYYAQLCGVMKFTKEKYPNKKGEYGELPKIYCIWICDKNPCNYNEGIMEFTKSERTHPITLYHLQRQIVLSRDALERIEDKELQDFLRLVGDTTEENALHSSWDMIHLVYQRYEWVRGNREMEEEFMLSYDEILYYQGVARKEGIEQGIEKGISQGIESEKEATVIRMLENHFDIVMIAKCVGLPLEEVQRIMEEHIPA